MTDATHPMDAMYRGQRHIYDATRKYFLLGRDALIAELAPPQGGTVLEIGCGTGRNLIRLARNRPDLACHGLDVSTLMLDIAARSIRRAGLADRITLARGDATAFDPETLFGVAAFDRIILSYALSMIPPWETAVARAVGALAPGGSVHIVDFGEAGALPATVRTGLRRWLALFDVTPRLSLPDRLGTLAAERGLDLDLRPRFRGYAIHAVLTRQGMPPAVSPGTAPSARSRTCASAR